MPQINESLLHDQIKQALLKQCGNDKTLEKYILSGGYDSYIEDFVEDFAVMANDRDEGEDDEEH